MSTDGVRGGRVWWRIRCERETRERPLSAGIYTVKTRVCLSPQVRWFVNASKKNHFRNNNKHAVGGPPLRPGAAARHPARAPLRGTQRSAVPLRGTQRCRCAAPRAPLRGTQRTRRCAKVRGRRGGSAEALATRRSAQPAAQLRKGIGHTLSLDAAAPARRARCVSGAPLLLYAP